MRYVGLDVHWRQSAICVLDTRGRKLSTQTIRGNWSKVLEELGKIKKPFSVCFEAATGYGYLFERLAVLSKFSADPRLGGRVAHEPLYAAARW